MKTAKKIVGLSLLSAVAFSTLLTPAFAVGPEITIAGGSTLSRGLTILAPTVLNVQGGVNLPGNIVVKDVLTINPDPIAKTSAFTGANFQLSPTSAGTVINLGGVTNGGITVGNGNVTQINGVQPSSHVTLGTGVTTTPVLTGPDGFTLIYPVVVQDSANVDIDFEGLDNVLAGQETEFQVTATATNIPQDKQYRYKATLTTDAGVPVANQEISYQVGGTWLTFTTDSDGVAYFGPSQGFKTQAIGLQNGITTNFKSTIANAGDYTLSVGLVNVSDDELVDDAGSFDFTVDAPE